MGKLLIALIGAGLISAAAPAVAADYVLDLKAEPEQESKFQDGREAIDNAGAVSSVRLLEPLEPQPKQSGLRVLILNAGPEAINFGPENVMIKLASGESVAMFSYQELLRKQKRREAWQALAAGLAAAGRNMQASQAGNSYGSATYSGNTFGNVGTTPYSATTFGTATYSGYNAGAAYAAQANANALNQQQFQAMQLQQAAARQDLSQVMKTTTVEPGQAFGGLMQYEVPREVRSSKSPLPVTIEVTVGSEVHVFKGTLGKAK